jgi:hypothetical protein
MRKIRAFFLETVQEHWPEEVIHGQASDLISPDQQKQEASEEACSLCSDTLASPVLPAQEKVRERPFTARSGTEESPRGTATYPGDQPVIVPDREQPQACQASSTHALKFLCDRMRRTSEKERETKPKGGVEWKMIS